MDTDVSPLTTTDSARSMLTGLLRDLIERSPGATRALLAAGDGIKLAYVDTDDAAGAADKLAATMSGLHSLGKGVFLEEEGGIRQVVIEHDAGWLCVMSAGAGTSSPAMVGTLLGVVLVASGNPGQVGHEMSTLIKGLDEHLVVQARQTTLNQQVL